MSVSATDIPGTTLVGAIRVHAARRGAAPLCHFLQGGRSQVISYASLLTEAGRYSRLFKAHGAKPGSIVLILLKHSPDLLHAFVGALMSGVVPSFMPPLTSKQDPEHYWTSHRTLFDRIGSGLILTDPSNAELIGRWLPTTPLRTVVADTRGLEPLEPAGEPSEDSVAFLQHSSGTTGVKKGVALSHRAVLAQIRSYAGALQLAATDVIVSWLPLYHDMGLVACFLLPLLTATPFVLVDPFEWVVNPGLLFTAIREHRGSLCWLPNFAFNHLCRTVRPSAGTDLSSVRAWVDCSEPCRPETFERFQQRFASAGVRTEHLQVCYAMAETVFAVTQTRPGAPVRVLEAASGAARPRALSTGRTIPGLEVVIRDDTGRPLPDGTVGEITVSGECLFSGYYHLPDETARKLRDGRYHTEDLGFLLDGELYVTGRKNDLIIVHGRNYYAHDLEFVINQVPGIHPGRAVAVGWFKPEVGSEEVVVIAEPSGPDGGDATLAMAIKQALLDASGLLVYDVRLVPAGWLIKTTSGKLSRTDNLRKYLDAIATP